MSSFRPQDDPRKPQEPTRKLQLAPNRLPGSPNRAPRAPSPDDMRHALRSRSFQRGEAMNGRPDAILRLFQAQGAFIMAQQ
eukprot:687761-Pyramimonas_sp.AAC.1